MSNCVCTIVCVLSDWLTVFRLHHAFGGHENQSRGREVGSRDKEARTPGLGRSYIHLSKIQTWVPAATRTINRMLLVGLHCLSSIDSPSRKRWNGKAEQLVVWETICDLSGVCLARHPFSFAPTPHARNPGFVWPFQQGEASRR